MRRSGVRSSSAPPIPPCIPRVLSEMTISLSLITSDVLERFQQEVPPQHKGARQQSYKLHPIQRLILPIRLSILSTAHIREYRDLRLRTVSPSTVSRELAVLRRAINQSTSIRLETPLLYEREASIALKRSRAGRPQPFEDSVLRTTSLFPRLPSLFVRGWLQRASLQVFLDP